MLVCAAWAYGGTETWAVRVVQATTFLSVAAGFAELRSARLAWTSPQFRSFWDKRWVYPLLLLTGYVLIQSINASHVYLSISDGLQTRSHVPFFPRSISMGISLQSLGKLWMYVGVMMVVRTFIDTRSSRQALIGALLLSGGCMSVLVLLQRAEHPNPPFPITGMFICDNNYAAYINLLLPLALCMGRASHVRASTHYQRSHPGYLLYLVAAIMVVAVWLSGSRAGAAISLGIVLVWFLIELMRSRRQGIVRLLALTGGILFLLTGGVGALLLFKPEGFSHDLGSLYGMTVGLQGRWELLCSSFDLLMSRWLGGVGAGCYAVAFPYYQSDALAGLYFSFAHNDWLQYLCELGLLGGGLLVALLVGLLPVETWRGMLPVRMGRKEKEGKGRSQRSVRGRYEREGLLLALGGLAVHALIDFPLHIPSIAIIAAAWVGLLGQQE